MNTPMTTTAERIPELTESARRQAAALGREMAKRDTWIEPIADIEVAGDEFLDFQHAHRAAWEETCQWEVLWNGRLLMLAEKDADEQGIDSAIDWEVWWFGFYEPAKDAMWEAWEVERDLYSFWSDNRGLNE